MNTQEKIAALVALITDHTKQEFLSNGYILEHHGDNWKAHSHEGKKYTRVDIGDSGRYMVDNASGEIFGIKGYGVIHRGYRFGTLDTIQDFYWGGYRAMKTAEAA